MTRVAVRLTGQWSYLVYLQFCLLVSVVGTVRALDDFQFYPPSPLLPHSLTNSLLHLSCNFICRRGCQISQSACVLCHSQGHEDESAVSWCQPEGLGLQPNGGRTQRVQVGQQATFTHYDTHSNLKSFVFSVISLQTCKHDLNTDAFVESTL